MAPRIRHIGEDHRGSAKNVVFEGYSFVDGHIVLDFAVSSDDDAGSDVNVLPKHAAFSQRSIILDVAKLPNLATGTDPGAFVHASCGMNKRTHDRLK